MEITLAPIVDYPMEDSKAQVVGIQAGDKIKKVNGKNDTL